MLTSNIPLNDTLEIKKTVNIDLNGKTISAPTKVFMVQGGVLNLTGTGTIKEENPNYGAIMVMGSQDYNDSNYSIVNIGKDVTLEGWSGIFINHSSKSAYGVVVNIDGKINAINDMNNDNGIGVYVNGNIKHQNNPPVINILDNAKITSTGTGLYIAGYSITNIKKSYISGLQSAIGIKAGILNIDGATIICEGKDLTPTEGYNNGIKASGTAIQIESNPGYAGNMEINIKSGILKSKESNVIYEYIGKGTQSLVNDINISGGTFTSDSNKNVFLFSDDFKTKHQKFITGGTYSNAPTTYLENGYTTISENNKFKVIKSTMKEIDSKKIEISNSKKHIWKILLIPAIVITIITIIKFFKGKNKILNKNNIIK